MCEKPLSALCTEKSNIKKSCKGLIKPTGCITEFLSGKKCNMQEENQNLKHFDNIKNKNFSIKFDECGKAEKEKLISKNFNSLPLFYYVSDLSHNGPGQAMMECPLRQPISGSSYYHHHYHHIPDQTKSLQELQNEVGALLEFRNLVIETFPDLKSKMASMSASHTLTGNSGSNSPFVSRLEWEPGIRIKRKLVQLKDSSSSSIFAEGGANDSTINSAQNHTELSSSSLTRSRSNSHSGKKEPKSGEGNGSVVIQDSGFSTETSSSKEAHSASSTTGALQGVVVANRLTFNELDDELLNLLDVIHRKSNKVREEIESIQNRETNRNYKNQATTVLLDQFGNKCSFASTSKGCVNQKVLQEYVDKLNKDDVQLLRKERDELLDKLAEMEAETLTGKIKMTKMENEVDELTKIKRELEEHLKLVLNQKMELNSRLQEFNKYHSGFTNNSSSPSDTLNHRHYTSTPLASGPLNLMSRYSPTTGLKDRDNSSKSTSTATVFSPAIIESDDTFNTPLSKSINIKKSANTFHSDIKQSSKYNTINLGHLDGFISEPCHLTKQRAIDSRKFSAILKETNVIELQRHLLTLTVQNQVLTQKLDEATKSNFQISQKFEKSKEDIDDFRFQLEEKKIELEGTKAQLRILESQTSKLSFNNASTISSTDEILHSQMSNPNHEDTVLSAKTSASEHIFDMEDICRQISTPSMKAMVPIAIEDIIQHNSSSTESAQDHNENGTCIAENVETNIITDMAQRRERPRPPSRIPLPGSKIGLTSPKPPTGRLSSSVVHTKSINMSNSGSISNKYLCRSTGNLCGKSPTNLNRPSSAQSLRKENSLLIANRSSTSSIPISSNLQSTGSSTSAGVGQSMSSSLNQGKLNPSQQNQQHKHNFHNSKFNSNSPIIKHKREHMSSSRARNLDSLSRNNQNSNNSNISSFSSSAPGRSNNNINNNNSNINNNSKNNNDRSFFNSSSTNFHRLNNNAKKDSSFNFAQTDNINSKSIKPKMNITTNIRRISTAGRSTTNNPITELQQQHLQLQQKPQGQGQLLLQQNNSQNADVDNGKVRNLRSTVLGWLKF
ncbi:putative uncharacterized protein DDB_G0282129 [Condylostylus longicornis]|uniref:putative uncharacterized protein DDB_G0282129 n=1 Tax=Condylostylus longicornis TaxID=2530218 RepID=UPI00244E2FC6|nr:putative uncharacterized protein DDB_G0282129 [Condylostylus longicornis]